MDNSTKKTIQTYEKIAFDYSKSHADNKRIKNLLDFFIQNINGKNVLDVGLVLEEMQNIFLNTV